MPGVSSGTTNIDCWVCRGAAGSVSPTTMKTWHRSPSAPELNHLRPLCTYSSPSRSIRRLMFVASEEAESASVMQNADRISPSSSGSSHRCSTSSEP